MTDLVTPGADSLALTVCRLVLDPATGRLRHRSRTGAAIRSALFVELALDGRIIGTRCPAPVQPDFFGSARTPTGSVPPPTMSDGHPPGMPGALYAALLSRGPTPWKRWFSHTGADADAALRALVDAGLAFRGEDGRVHDRTPDLTARQAQRVTELMRAAAGAPSPAAFGAVAGAIPVGDAVVALLATAAGLSGGRPRPRVALRQLRRLLPPSGASGATGTGTLETVRLAVRHGLTTMRGRAGSRLLSG